MDLIASIIGIFAICFLLAYVLFALDPEHILLKLLLFFIFLVCLPLVPKILIDNADHCEIVLNHSEEVYIYGNNFTAGALHWQEEDPSNPNTFANDAFLLHRNTTNQYSRICFTNTEGTYATLLGVTVWVWRLTILYMLLFLTWQGLKFSGLVIPNKKSKLGWRIR